MLRGEGVSPRSQGQGLKAKGAGLDWPLSGMGEEAVKMKNDAGTAAVLGPAKIESQGPTGAPVHTPG